MLQRRQFTDAGFPLPQHGRGRSGPPNPITTKVTQKTAVWTICEFDLQRLC